ncbi:MAG TPA: acylphosphatase, partial [Parafilimonas sp.]|nr:acylphosphatase [Parafilimonas sp.]
MTFHLHIKGRVQGVGFRPHVYRSALKKNVFGYVNNGADGVHVIFNHTCRTNAETFVEELLHRAPSRSIIQSYLLQEADEQNFNRFSICVGEDDAEPDLLISPDFAMCGQCRDEFHDKTNRRYQYPFITCTICGPRYSVMSELPYERHLTTMSHFHQCAQCLDEYRDANDRRYFSQTNSCASCGVHL